MYIMEQATIDGIIIYFKNGNKHRKSSTGKLKLVCMVEDCNKLVNHGETGHYCGSHLTKLSGGDNDKRKKLVLESNEMYERNIKKFQDEQKIMIEKSKITIGEIEIYIIDSMKYRKDSLGRLLRVCTYDKCNKFAHYNCSYKYCQSHKDGTDPNSEARKKEVIDRNNNARIRGTDFLKIGDATEKWVAEKLKQINSIHDIETIGYNGSKYDIEFKLTNETNIRGIQVKTLTKKKGTNDSYTFDIRNNKYSNNTLFIGVSKDRTRFVLIFYKDFKNCHPNFNFGSGKSYYLNYMFTNYNIFMIKLEIMLKQTDFCDNKCREKYTEREYQCLLQLENKCKKHMLSFHRIEEAGSKIDCVINGYNIQCKASQNTTYNIYNFSIQKNGGRKNGKATRVPYSDKDDIDFFIFQIIDFKDNYYIVPIEIMIENGCIHTNTSTGLKTFNIPNPETGKKSHWINEYLNKFCLLKPIKIM